MRYTKREIAAKVAREEAQGADGNTTYELLLEGFDGYANWELTDLVERWVNDGNLPEDEKDGKIEVESFGRVFSVQVEDGRFSSLSEKKD